jgi:hypothetical protein
VIQARWERIEESAVQIAWAKELRDKLAPYATGGAYANFLAADELHRVSAAHRSGKLSSTPRIEVKIRSRKRCSR